MAVTMRNGAVSRRRVLASLTAAGATTFAGGIAKPYLSRAADRPVITHGVQSGDVSIDSGVVWARADRPARMVVEAVDDGKLQRRSSAAPQSTHCRRRDFTAKALLEGLPSGQDILYRVTFEDLAHPLIRSEPVIGRFRTAPSEPRSVSFVWSGDTCGGWGIDESRGGMRTYATMLRNRPDFFVHCGDSIYAECPLGAEQKLPNGEVWRNVLTEEKSRVAETLADFRGNYKYNLLDRNLRAFNAEVPTFAQWDDHEVTNDWWPGMPLVVGEADITKLAARGCRAFHEFMPTRQFAAERGRIYRKIAYGPLLDVFMLDMRSYRGPNGNKDRSYTEAAHFLGPAQVAWLKRELAASRATWKVIAADLPLGILCHDAAALGDGPPVGRELEIADVLSFIKHAERAQHGLDHGRSALHGGALLRSKSCGVSGFRPVLGVHVGADPRRHRRPRKARQHVRSAHGLLQCLCARAGRRPRTVLRPAILRTRGDRRRHSGDDGHPQGCAGPRALVD